ncbi:MAG: LysR family transcriptional regulator [Spirochaetaceae bacterium]|nr:LysR family transcriptional regulator [Spirochaetaceae bacterium]
MAIYMWIASHCVFAMTTINYMTLQQIKYILGVADSGSFNKASEKLFISQPSLTSSVHDAENELGFQIFNRSTRGVTLTERGKDFIKDAQNLYSKYEELLKKHCGAEKKIFSVSTLYYAFARKAFVEIVKKYSAQGYDFAFCEKKASDVIEDVADETSTIGILYLSDSNREEIIKSLKSAKLEFHHLTECNAFVYLHKKHPLAKKESISLKELQEYRFITFDTDDVKSFFSEQVIAQYGLDKAITVADRATELNLIEQLNGYTFLSGIYGEDSSASDGLTDSSDSGENFVLIPLQNLDENISHCFELGYITKTGRRMNDISLTYIDVIRRILHIAGFTC